MQKFYNIYGLINPTSQDIVSENCPLVTVEYIFLLGLESKRNMLLEQALRSYIEALKNPITNRFNNIPGLLEGEDRYISHDQYTSICCYSYSRGLSYHKEFWKNVKFGTYDNLTGKFNINRILHPRDYIFLGYLNRNLVCTLLMPLFYLLTLIMFSTRYKVRPTLWERIKSGFTLSTRKIEKTDDELLTFVRFNCFKKKPWHFRIVYAICMKLLAFRFEGGLTGAWQTYYKEPDQPIRVLIGK